VYAISWTGVFHFVCPLQDSNGEFVVYHNIDTETKDLFILMSLGYLEPLFLEKRKLRAGLTSFFEYLSNFRECII
jgi:hypothetical protein